MLKKMKTKKSITLANKIWSNIYVGWIA